MKKLPDHLDQWNERWRVQGWIGTAQQPKDLDNPDAGNLNSVVVFSRGRLFHENILEKVNDGRLYTKYLTGQIEADFLDEDNETDIATSDRQRIQEDDPRFEALLEFLKASLRKVENQWNIWRREHELKRVRNSFPGLNTWFETLKLRDHRENAEKLIAKLSSLPIDEEEDRKLLLKHVFWRLRE